MKKTTLYRQACGAFTFLLLLFSISACKKQEQSKEGDTTVNGPYQPISIKPTTGTRIAWDFSSFAKLADQGTAPQMIRISETSLLLVYELSGQIQYRRSDDNGLTWLDANVLFPKYTYTGKDGSYDLTFTDLMAQPTIIRLQNGNLLAACAIYSSYTLGGIVTQFPSGILVRQLTNETWNLEPVQEVYRNLGCDHPSLVALPNGTIQLYFTNGNASQDVQVLRSTELSIEIAEQKIEMIASVDDGLTWTSRLEAYGPDGVMHHWVGATPIASRHDKNNHDPSAAVVGNEIVVSFADNKTLTYKPFTVRTNLNANWPAASNGDTPERMYALYELLPENYRMDAPYLLTLPSGNTLLSYETDAGRLDDREIMEVAVGNQQAMDFTNYSQPFAVDLQHTAKQSSLLLFDESTVMALASSDYDNTDKVLAPWTMKGYLIDEWEVNKAEITEFPLFVGAQTISHMRVGLGKDAANLYITAKVVDPMAIHAEKDQVLGDGIYVYIDAPNLSLRDVDAGVTKIWVSSAGDIIRWDGKEGQWAKSSTDGLKATVTETTGGYDIHLTVPKDKLIRLNDQTIRFAAGFSDYTSADVGYTELLSLCEDLRSSTWLGVHFK